jgi:hypothetical protein
MKYNLHLKNMASIGELYRTGYIAVDHSVQTPEKSWVLTLQRTDLDTFDLYKPQEAARIVTLDLSAYLKDRVKPVNSLMIRTQEATSVGRDFIITATIREGGIYQLACIQSRDKANRLEIVFPMASAKAYPEFQAQEPDGIPISSSLYQMLTIQEYSQLFSYTERALKGNWYPGEIRHPRELRKGSRIAMVEV